MIPGKVQASAALLLHPDIVARFGHEVNRSVIALRSEESRSAETEIGETARSAMRLSNSHIAFMVRKHLVEYV